MATTGFTVRLERKDVDRRIALLKRPEVPLARAINRSLGSGKTMVVRLIAEDLGIKVGDVRPYVREERATPVRLQASLFASAARIPLIKFNAKGREPSLGKPPGVRARVKGGAGTYPHAFIATMPGGHRGVFVRKGAAKRFPIVELRGPSLWQVFQKHQAAAVARAEEQLFKNVQHELEYALSR